MRQVPSRPQLKRDPFDGATTDPKMPRLLTVLEAHVALERQDDLQAAYRDAARDSLPPGLIRSVLLRATSDRTLWRIETLWDSRDALEAMRGRGTPRGVLIFRSAGAEPTLSILEVAAELSPSKDAV